MFNWNKNYYTLFACSFWATITAGILAIVFFSIILVPIYITKFAEEHSSKVIEYLEDDLQYPLLVGNEEALEEYADTLGELPWIDSVQFATPDFSKSYSMGEKTLENTAGMYGEGIRHWEEEGQLHSTKIIRIGGDGSPEIVGGYVHIGINTANTKLASLGVMGVLILSILCTGVVMILMFKWASHKVVEPIVTLSQKVQEIRKGENGYTRIEVVDEPHEIKKMSEVVNEFVDSANENKDYLESEVDRRIIEVETALEKLKTSESFRMSMMMNSSHDLRSPLTSLIGFIDMAREYTMANQEKKAIDALDVAHSASLEMQEQIETFLVYMGDEGSEIIREDKIIVDALVQQVLYQLKATELQSESTTSYKHTGPVDVVIDKPKFERVLHGLISNAYNYCNNGKVVIKTHVDEALTITVEDTGVGMDADRMETIFIKDYSGGESAHSGHRGVGIGLAMCKGWVDMMEGEIHVESKKGKMTKFTVNIPVKILEPAP